MLGTTPGPVSWVLPKVPYLESFLDMGPGTTL